jgi:DNA processing protein
MAPRSIYPIVKYLPDDEAYPYRLRECPQRPAQLYMRGNIPPSSEHVVAIVGTRQPTERGKELTETLVRELHERLSSLTIVSGGAYGIDIAAHRAANKYGVPTIMVLAHGLDRVYPYQHIHDAEEAMERGGVVSEYPEGIEPFATNFLQRNRIIAGMADAVVIVESKERGGSLNTARWAKGFGRALFAFPGRPGDLSSRGCNDLIRTGQATLINSADDLIEAMEWRPQHVAKGGVQTQLIGLIDGLSEPQQAILERLQVAEEGMHINLLVEAMGMPYGEVASEIVMLEMQGLVRALPGGIYRFVR